MTAAEKPPAMRIRQGLALLVGAVVLALLVEGTLAFFWTPLILGLTYLVAAGIGGRNGGYWATACVLTGWGLAVVISGEATLTDIDTSGLYLLGAGLGAVAGILLARARFAVSDLGLAATVAAAGLILAISPTFPDLLYDARTFAIAIGLVGLLNVGLGAAGRAE